MDLSKLKRTGITQSVCSYHSGPKPESMMKDSRAAKHLEISSILLKRPQVGEEVSKERLQKLKMHLTK